MPSTFVRQIDRCGTLSAGRRAALCADIAPPLAVPVRSIVRWSACQSSAARALATSSFRGSRSLLESQTFLPCSLVTAPRVAFVDASSCPPPARHSVATAWLGGVRAHASCLSAEVNRPPTHASALGSFFGVLDRPGRITLES